MNDALSGDPAPTSGATTADTEAEVVAAISSAEGNPETEHLDHAAGKQTSMPVTAIAAAVAGLAIGLGAALLFRRSR